MFMSFSVHVSISDVLLFGRKGGREGGREGGRGRGRDGRTEGGSKGRVGGGSNEDGAKERGEG